MSLVNKSLHFGLQNFFFVKADETDGTYDYVAYIDHKGLVLLARFDKAGDNALYYVATGTFSTIWTGRAGYTYLTPDQLGDLQI